MPSDLTVSVALATYNGARFLREQLDSLARQTLPPCELVVCDDGSTDGTRALLDEWAHGAPFPVRVHPNPERLGYADNFLRAASLCRGDLVAFCDQDDVWLPEKLAECARRFGADSDVMLVSHNAWVVDQDLTRQGLHHADKTLRTFPRGQFRLFDFNAHGFTIVFRTALMRHFPWGDRPTDYILKGPMPHDHWVTFLASVAGKIVLDGRPLAFYRQHTANTFGSDGRGFAEFKTRTPLKTHDSLLGMRTLLSGWAKALSDLAASAPDAERQLLLSEASDRCRDIEARYKARARLYESGLGLSGRMLRLFALTRMGGYRSHRKGGLGLRPLARDLVASGLPFQRGSGR